MLEIIAKSFLVFAVIRMISQVINLRIMRVHLFGPPIDTEDESEWQAYLYTLLWAVGIISLVSLIVVTKSFYTLMFVALGVALLHRKGRRSGNETWERRAVGDRRKPVNANKGVYL